MKGNNIFNTWFREFCTLVFIQTIQAFIFAIIMVLIIAVMTPSDVSGVDRSDSIAATGMIAVIALASVSKMEELVKKIFGIKPGIADPSMRGGMKSLATTMMAAKLAKNVGDNIKKVGGGIGGFVGANKAMTQTKARFARDMRNYGTTPVTALSGGETPPAPPSLSPANGGGSTGGSAAGGSAGSSNNTKDLDKYYQKVDAYKDKMAELKKKRRDAVFSGISGITESAGALAGGTMGAIGGAALGEGREIIQGGLAGMGVGDALGGLTVKPIKGFDDAVSSVKSYNKSKQQFIDEVSRTSRDAKDAIEKRRGALTRFGAAKKAYSDFEKQVFDAGDLD